MQTSFFQEFLNMVMFKKLTTVFPSLREETLDSKRIEETLRQFKREGLLEVIERSNQDPKELAEMALIAFDVSTKKARDRFEKGLKAVVEHLATQRKTA